MLNVKSIAVFIKNIIVNEEYMPKLAFIQKQNYLANFTVSEMEYKFKIESV